MYLTPEEEKMLKGEFGLGVQKAMEILCAIGDIYDAKRLIPIKSAQVSGASYKTIGDAGIDFIRDFSNKCKVSVLTTLNPLGMDVESWREHGISEKFAKKQIEILDSYVKMGIEPTATCTPYFVGNLPSLGEHIAWGESSAVSYSNSVLGARTNREGGPSALASAIVGKTPEYGLHIDENRRAGLVIEVDFENMLDNKKSDDRLILDFATLGAFVGKIVGNKIPYFRGIKGEKEVLKDNLKSLGAAMAASGAVALYHVEGVTPEYKNAIVDKVEKIQVGKEELEKTREKLNTYNTDNGKHGKPELITLGCPHCSIQELRLIADTLTKLGKHRKRDKEVELWVCTARQLKNIAHEEVKIISRYGKVVCDTCMVVAPIEEKYKITGTNSAKAACYLPGLCSQKVVYNDTKSLLDMLFV